MPRAKDAELESAFHTWKDEERRGLTVRCNHCGWTRAKHAGRQRRHLEECPSLVSSHSLPHNQPSGAAQTTQQRQRLLSLFGARSLIMTASPFGTWDDYWMREYLRVVGNDPAYEPPTRRQVITDLSNELFRQEWRAVKVKLEMCSYIDVVVERIPSAGIGMWVVAGGAVYFWTILEGGPSEVAEGLFQNVSAMLSHRIHEVQWSRWNSLLVGDTRDEVLHHVMSCVRADERTNHVWCIPCVGRAVQRLIRALLESETLRGAWEGAETVLRAVREKVGGLQWEILRDHQRRCYKQPRPIIIPYVESWGSQYDLLRCIHQNGAALQAWAIDPRVQIAEDAQRLIVSPNFWMHIEMATRIVSGLHDHQRAAETDPHFNVGKVLPMWTNMLRHIQANCPQQAFPHLAEIYEEHRKQVLLDIFTVAHSLDPRNATTMPPAPQVTNTLIDFVRHYCAKPDEARAQFTQFCTGTGTFTRTNRVYELISQPKEFWNEMMMYVRPLGEMAFRIFATPATSLPTQRDFLTARPIHVSWRVSFGCQKANELYFIYLNRRLLNCGTSAYLQSDALMLEREDRDFAALDSHDDPPGSEDLPDSPRLPQQQHQPQLHSSSTTATPQNPPREINSSVSLQDAPAVPISASPPPPPPQEPGPEIKNEGVPERPVEDLPPQDNTPPGIALGMSADDSDLDAQGVPDEMDGIGPESLGAVMGGLGGGLGTPAQTTGTPGGHTPAAGGGEQAQQGGEREAEGDAGGGEQLATGGVEAGGGEVSGIREEGMPLEEALVEEALPV